MKRKNVLTGIVFLLLVLFCQSTVFAAIVDPPLEVYVGDYANVLTDETEQYIIEKNQDLSKATGAQIVVVTVDFLDGIPIEEYAYTIFNQWGIGDADKNNGLLLLLAIGEDNYWVMQGKGLEDVLSSGTLGDYLAQDLEPDFAVGNYDSGVNKIFRSFCDWFTDYYQLELQSDSNIAIVVDSAQDQTTGNSFPMIGLLACIIIVLYIINTKQNNRRRIMNNRYDTKESCEPQDPNYRRVFVPRAPSTSVYMPPCKKTKNKKRNTNSNSWFGGGTSRGGGAGRSSSNSTKSVSSGIGKSTNSYGGGTSRGGGAGRR